MRKLLSLVLAFAMILGLFAFPVSADESMYQAVGQELMNYGVIKGGSNGLAEMDKLTREESLVVLSRLKGEEDKALATEAVADFTDVPATHWAAKYVAYAKLQGWTTGVSEKEFGLGQQVTTQQIVTFMMRALGYKEVKWEEAMTKAKELGLLEGVSAMAEDQIIRGEVFIVMKNTLYTKPMNEKQELIYKLGLKENPVPETLEVVDVKADNLLEVVVEFNQEVDKDSLKDAFRFVGSNQGALTPELKEDGKTVVVTLGTEFKQNRKMYKLEVSKVKTLSGLMLEKVVKEFKAEDVKVPEVESIVVTGPKNFDVIFSEPLVFVGTNSFAKIKIAGKNGPSTSAKVNDADRRKVNVTTSTLKDGTTYTVVIGDAWDYARYKSIDAEMEFPYAKVTTAPTVEVVKATQEYVEFKFDRPVKNLTKDNFYHTYSSWKAVGLFKDVASMNKLVASKIYKDSTITQDTYMDKVVVRFVEDVNKLKDTEHPLPSGDVEVNVLGLNNHKKVVDHWNNAMADARLVVSVAADKEAPVVENVEATGENTIEVTFSKPVNSKTNKDNFELLKEDGSKISGLVLKVELDKAVVKLTVTSPDLVGKTVILNIKDVKDNTINLNKMASVESQTITFGDKTFEGIKEASYKKFKDEKLVKIRLKFDEAIDTTVAADAKNYKLEKGSKLLNASFETSILTDRIVELVFDQDTWLEKVQGVAKTDLSTKTMDDVIYVLMNVKMSNAVTDAVGNKIATFEQTIGLVNASVAPTVKSVNAVANDKIEVTFSETVVVDGGFDAGEFTVSGKKPYSVDHENDKAVLNFDEKNLLPSDPEKTALKLKYSGNDIESETGGVLTWDNAGIPIKDKIAPAYVSLPSDFNADFYKSGVAAGQYGDLGFTHSDELTFGEPAVLAKWNDAAKRYEVVVVYTEEIDKNTIGSTTTYSVNGWAITEVPVLAGTGKNVVIIPLAFNKLEEVMFENITLTQNTSIKDAKGNVLAKSEAPVVIQEKMKTANFNMTSGTANAKANLAARVGVLNAYKTSDEVATWDLAAQGAISHLAAGKQAFETFKNKLDAANTASSHASTATLAEIKKAEKELNDAFDAFKEYAKNVAPGLTSSQQNNVTAGTDEVNQVDFGSVTEGTHFVKGKDKASLVFEVGQTLPTEAVDFSTNKKHVILEAAVALIKVDAQNKVEKYEFVDLAGKKGEMTAAPTEVKLVNGSSNPFTSGNTASLLGDGAVTLGSWTTGSQENFRVQFEGTDAQKMDVEVTGAVVEDSPKSYQDVVKSTPSGDFKVTGTGKITVKVTIKENKKVSRVIVKEITVQ